MNIERKDKPNKPKYTTRTSKSYNRYKKKSTGSYNRQRMGEEPSLKQEMFFIRASVSLIIVVVAFAIAKFNTPTTNQVKEKLKIAMSENISFDEAKAYGEKGMDILYSFKEKQTDKIDSIMESEPVFFNDSELVN